MRNKPRVNKPKVDGVTPKPPRVKGVKVSTAPKVRSVLRKDHARRTKLA
jgi:hypothetical protein